MCMGIPMCCPYKRKKMRIINIKKYSNRKLYSPKNELFDFGSYVTLKDLEDAIKR